MPEASEPDPEVEPQAAPVTNINGGVNLDAGRDITIGGDVVGRDKTTTDIDTGGGAYIGENVYTTEFVGRDKITVGYTVEQVSTLFTQISSTFQPRPFDGRCPYLGLDAFTEDDADRFFGREKLIDELVARVKQSRFLIIAGPSGSGKSSLVRAGLIQALKQGALPNSDRWLYATLTPGRDPIESLAVAMSRLAKSPDAGKYMREHSAEANALHEYAESQLSDRPDQRTMIIVDQFEEVFTQVSKEDQRIAFLSLLTHAATTEGGRVTVLFALRSDFVSNCATYPQLNALLNQQFMQVGAMQPDELVSAIARPALQVGLRIDPDLVAQIVNDMQDEPGALPLMQFALKDLFDAQQAKGGVIALTLNDYLARGGLHKALERHADAAFAMLREDEKQLARIIFSGLVEIGRGTQVTRRTALFDELVPANTDATKVRAVIEALVGARLITIDVLVSDASQEASENPKVIVTLAHETLIDAWPWLRKLVKENRDAIALQNQITEDAQEWDKRERDASYVYSGARLANAREQLKAKKVTLNELAQAFVTAGVRRAHWRRIRQVIVAGAIVAVIVGGLFGLAVLQSQRAAARARLLVTQGQAVYEDRPLLGLRLALEGLILLPKDDLNGRAEIANSVADLAKKGRLLKLGNDVSGIWGESGKFVVVAYKLASGELRRSDGAYVTTLSGKVDEVYFSPVAEARYFVVHYADAPDEVWSNVEGQRVATLNKRVGGVSFSPDAEARYFAVHYLYDSSELWNNAEGQRVATLSGKVNDVYFSPDAEVRYFLVFYSDAPSEVWSNVEGRRVATFSGTADFDPFGGKIGFFLILTQVDPPYTGNYFIVYSSKTAAPSELWSLFAGRRVAVLNSIPHYLRFSPAAGARYLVVSYRARTPEGQSFRDEVWSTEGKLVATLRQSPIQWVHFSLATDAPFFIIEYSDEPSEVWSNVEGKRVATLSGPVRQVFFSRATDAPYFVVHYNHVPDEVWSNVEGKRVVTLSGKVDEVYFSPATGARYFVMHYADAPDEVWSNVEGKRVATLSGKVDEVYFSPAVEARYFVVHYADAPSEVWSSVEGNRVVTLTNLVSDVSFSPDAEARYFVVNYYDVPSEVWSSEGQLVATLSGKVRDVHFSPDAEARYLLVQYDDGYELWDTQLGRLTSLEPVVVAEYRFDLKSQHLLVRYSDGRAYVLDLGWLVAMRGNPMALPAEELMRLACQGPLAGGVFNENDLKPYLEDDLPQACR